MGAQPSIGSFVCLSLAIAAGIAAPLLSRHDVSAAEPASAYRAYFGTYTGGAGKGIYVAEFDPATGKLGEPRLAGEAVNPSFLAIHPSNKYLYAVGEVSDFAGKKSGGVSAFAIDPKLGSLQLINQMPSGGGGPCHLTVDATGKCVLVANYGGGSVASLPLGDDGSLREPASFIQHEGSSVDKARQQGPHAHSINIDAQNRYAIAADLGLDKLLVYRLDAAQGTITPNDPPSTSLPAGGGPRHFAFHPDGRHAYACNEMTSTVSALDYDPRTGKLTELQTISTLPQPVEGNSTAEVRVHPSGKFVYVSNRGHNSIAIFAVDPKNGQLKPVGHESTRGKVPRNFNLDPTGKFLLAANQDSANVVVFAVDPATGQLSPTGSEISVDRPVCIRFVPIAR